MSYVSNPSCHLLAFHGILRFNEGENTTTLGEEEPHRLSDSNGEILGVKELSLVTQ